MDILTPYYSDERPCNFYSIVENAALSSSGVKCNECTDFKRKFLKPDDAAVYEFAEIEVDGALPSSEIRDIDLFEKYSLQKYVKGLS